MECKEFDSIVKDRSIADTEIMFYTQNAYGVVLRFKMSLQSLWNKCRASGTNKGAINTHIAI